MRVFVLIRGTGSNRENLWTYGKRNFIGGLNPMPLHNTKTFFKKYQRRNF